MIFPPQKSDYKIKINVKINKNIDNLIVNSINTYSSNVLVYKNNKKIISIDNTKDNKLIETYSITKSFCSLAIMLLIQDKKIKSVDDKISNYIKQWKYGAKKDITIKHILTRTSGLDRYWNFNTFMFPEGKWQLLGKKDKPNIKEISLVIDKVRDNGEFYYGGSDFQILCTLIHQIIGMQIDKYLEKKFFKPLNIKYKWNKDSNGNPYAMNGLMISCEDLCKVGMFILNNGKYNNKQLLNSNLVKEMIKQRIYKKNIKDWKYNEGNGYAYLYWKYKDMTISNGFLGQNLIIDKKKKIVACRLIEPKWENKKFEKATQEDKLHFSNFKKLIEKL